MDHRDFLPQLCIVQITDLHFGPEFQDSFKNRIDDILNTIKSSIESGTVLLLVTGDIVFSGKEAEYHAASVFFDYLIEQLQSKKYQLYFYFLPGNHDLQDPCESIERFSESQYDLDIKKMTSFFKFAERYGSIFSAGQPEPISFEVGGTCVSVCGFNSAPLSTLVGDDKGFHRLKVRDRGIFNGTPDSGLHIFASHHGPEWFRDNERLGLEKSLTNSVDLAFFGHEHMGPSRLSGDLTDDACVIVRGGTYSISDDSQSSYKLLLLRFGELGSYDFVEKEYVWNPSEQLHSLSTNSGSNFRFIKSNTSFRPSLNFVDELLAAKGSSVKTFKEAFVFPSLKEEIASGTKDGDLRINNHETIADIHSFMELLADSKTLEIHGDIRAGKSSLLIAIYFEALAMGYSPLLLTPDNSTGSITKTLNAIIKEQYGDSRDAVERFGRIPREKILLLVDDFDMLKRKARKGEVIQSMLQTAGSIILMADNGFQFDLDEAVGTDFRNLLICPWTKNKRDQLIRRRCNGADLSNEKVDGLISVVDKAVHSHFHLFEMTPPFINQYIDFYIYESGASFLQGDLPFTSIMTTNVKRKIRGSVSGSDSRYIDVLVDAVIASLMKLALHIHSERTTIFSNILFSKVTNKYLTDYGIPYKPKDIMEAAVQSGLVLINDNGYDCSFASRSLHAFFVAQAIDFTLDEDEEEGGRYVSRLLDELDYPINEEILVLLEGTRFIPKLTNDLMDRAASAVMESDSLSFQDKRYQCLTGLDGLRINPPSSESARAARGATDEMERRGCEAIDSVSYSGIYEYEIPENRNSFQSAIMALKYVAIAGRCLGRQQARLKESVKAEVRERILHVTGKALNMILLAIDSSFEEMVEEASGHFDNQVEAKPKVRKLLSIVALAGCMGELDTVVSNSCSTLNVLGFSEISDESDFYSLFRLSLFLRANQEKDFCNEAKSSIKNARAHSNLPLIISISLLSARYIIERPHMSKSARQSLIDTVFNGSQKARAAFLKSAHT